MKNISKHIVKITEWSISFVIFFLILLSLLPYIPLGNRIQSYVITSGSMEPTIPTGAVAFVIPKQSYKPNDIIAFRVPDQGDTPIIHRITEKSIQNGADVYTTKGDNNDSPDQWTLSNSNIIGTYIFAVPFIGQPAALIRKPVGFFLIIGLPLAYFAWKSLMLIFDGISEERKKRKTKKSPAETALLLSLGIGLLSMTFYHTKSAHALFSSQATVYGITISTIGSISPTPSLSPTPSISPTPTDSITPSPTTSPTPSLVPTPTPNPSPCGGDITVIISGNGSGSSSNVTITKDCDIVIHQNSSTHGNSIIETMSSSGGNTIEGNQQGSIVAGSSVSESTVSIETETNTTEE